MAQMAKLTEANRKRFLQAFVETGTIGEAARLAGVGRRSYYHWMEDPEFAREFAEAVEEVADRMETELHRRIYQGTDEPVVWQGQVQYKVDKNGRNTGVPVTVRRKSDTLLIFAMKSLKPSKFRDNVRAELLHQADVRVSHSPLDLSKLTDEELRQLAEMFQRCSPGSESVNMPEGQAKDEESG